MCIVFKVIIDAIRHKAPLTGYWYSLIVENGAVVKSDLYHLYQNRWTGEIVGKMERVYPPEQAGRKWEVSGMFNLQTLILYSHSRALNTSMAAAVCKLEQDNYFEGYYLRYSEDKRRMEQIEICYQKIIPKRSLFRRREIDERRKALYTEIINGRIPKKRFSDAQHSSRPIT